ncbi:receptor-like protein EIX1 [Pistacia vera]|uniref:receptor-like protein EIX1 n=1 Tax=Pistacia vera TaxID=55513 RepID=UPI001262F116|nr:receptor-like protein EIX1 [Pistacia vera]
MSNPGNEHWNALKWLMRYINGTVQIGLMFCKRYASLDLVGYVDADFAGDRDSRKSTTAYYFTLGGNCVSWKAQLQPLVALSTTEAEYVAVLDAFKEATWLQGILKEANLLNGTATVYSDSQSAIHLSKNPVYHERTKHVDVRHHYVRDLIAKVELNLLKVPTEDNPADMGTKVVTTAKFKHCLNLLHISLGYNTFPFITIATINVSFCKASSYMGFIKSEREALLRFKKDLIDPMNRLASWNSSHRDCCTWSGIVCNNVTGHVLELNLRNPPLEEDASSPAESDAENSMLGGKINPSLLDLKQLRSLDLGDNNFEGIQIPRFLGSMHNLRYLNLSLSDFQGVIPHQLENLSNLLYLALEGSLDIDNLGLSHLQGLLLDDNGLKGTLRILGNLTSIEELDLSSNGFEGGIPKSIRRLCNLRSITISYVNLSQPISDVLDIFSRCVSNVLEILDLQESQVFGQLSERLGQFKKLNIVRLHYNSLSGFIPSALGELSTLQLLSIGYNRLNGILSEMHFSNLTRLFVFHAFGKSLMFQVSPHWVPPFKLEVLGLGSCHLGPQFPPWLRSQKHLEYLDISNSRIKDAIPTFVFKIPFNFVNLSHNQIYGQIRNLTKSTQLEVLDLNSNRLSGPLPLLPFNLYLLDLSNNVLSRSIFHLLCHKMNESKRMMQILILNNNFLSEVTPDCWMNLKGLEVLNLDNC